MNHELFHAIEEYEKLCAPLEESFMKLWQIGLVCFLSLYGLLLISNVKFEAQNLLLGITALATAILCALDR